MIRVRSRGSRSTPETTTQWCSCDTSRRRFTASNRSRAEVFDALSGPGGSTWSKRVPGLGSALAALERPLVLVLDDLHAVANLSCLDVLAGLVEYVPAGSQIAIASREAPELPLARWRAHGGVQEIGVAELRLDEQEAGSLLRAAGIELEAGELSELTERTEGWPAGLYLAALSMQAGAPSSAGAAAFTGDDRFVSEYFRFELLSRLPPAEARFLQYTSVLDRMCGGLCDAVLQTRQSAHTLEALERTNGFVVPLDRRGEWYRYHHLFGELLHHELERSEPKVVSALNARAMAWCIANDMPEAAVVYGHAAGETDTVAGLVDALALSVHYDGRMQTLEEWLGWFGDDELRRYPALAVYGAWVRALTGRPEEAERWLALAEGATSTIALSDGSATIEPWVATLRAHMMPNGVEQALADTELALNQLPPESDWVLVALLGRGVAHALLGATDRAVDDLTAVVDKGLAAAATEEVVLAQAQLALLAANQGAWGEAGQRARAAQALADEAGLGDYSTSAIAHVATARVALHEGRQDDARAALARVHRLRPLLDHGIPWLTVQVGLELARAHLALADPGAARTVLTETEHVLELRPHMGSPRRPRAGAARPRRRDRRVGRCLGDEPDSRGTQAASIPRDASHVPGDREQAVHLAQHRQERGGCALPQARGRLAQPGDRACRRDRAAGEHDLPAAGTFHPGRMMRTQAAAGGMCDRVD